MPTYSGVWSLPAQYQAKANLQWPQGPGAPTSVSATAGDTQATITFVAPTFTGVPPGITGYLATSSPGGFTATGSASPLTVTGLSNGTAYTFTVQATNGVQYGPAGTSGSVTPQLVRALFIGGYEFNTPKYYQTVEYVNPSTTGNSSSFGDLNVSLYNYTQSFALSSSTRVVCGAVYDGTTGTNVMAYFTVATTGNSTSFGQLTVTARSRSGAANSTRGLIAGGAQNNTNVIEYITIATTSNSTDFGDLSLAQATCQMGGSSTRALFGFDLSNVIEYVTIASAGNSTDFGDLAVTADSGAGGSSSTRMVFATGNGNVINYVTIASAGNATDFGDLTVNRKRFGAASNSTRVLFDGGLTPAITLSNVIDYITIASTGNSVDFGDLNGVRQFGSAACNGHGGL